MLSPGLLPGLEDPECLADGEDLRVEDLLVIAQVEQPACPPILSLPGASRANLAIVKTGAVRPDGALSSPLPGCLKGLCLGGDLAQTWEGPALAPDLRLHRLAWSGVGRRPESPDHGPIVALQDLLGPPPSWGLV